MYIVVMDFIVGHGIGAAQLSCDNVNALREALRILHDNDLVYGDLRGPNVICSLILTGRAEQGKRPYPPDINMDPAIGWHPDVCRGGLIHREHDVFMLDRLERGAG